MILWKKFKIMKVFCFLLSLYVRAYLPKSLGNRLNNNVLFDHVLLMSAAEIR